MLEGRNYMIKTAIWFGVFVFVALWILAKIAGL